MLFFFQNTYFSILYAMKVTVASVSETGVFTLDVSEDLEIQNFKVCFCDFFPRFFVNIYTM